MPTTKRTPAVAAPQRFSPPEADFDEMLQKGSVVEHLTIAAFLARIPHKRHIDDIARFSKEVAKGADALQAAFVTTVHPKLGVLRIFPLPLLERVYEIWAPQFRWPLLIDVAPPLSLAPGTLRSSRQALQANERFASHLRTILEGSQNIDVQHSAAVLIHWLDQECARIRQELEPEETPG